MAEGHCLICPLQHHCCATGLDEDVWSEIQVSKAPDLEAKMIVLLLPPTHAHTHSQPKFLCHCLWFLFFSSAVSAYSCAHV